MGLATRHRGTPKEIRALDAYIKLMRGTESVTRRIHEHLADTGLTLIQFGVLEALLHLGPLSQRELGGKLLRTAGNITNVMSQLESRGLVERDRTIRNRRTCVADLTPAGRRLVTRVFPRHVAAVVREFSVLGPAEQVMLGALCRRLGRGEKPD
jgi:MarR family 2-MHQ and catechol resistance regulon transcriptional repressor